MGEILSQDEIDKLLNQLNSGDSEDVLLKPENERKVVTYNFARPSKFNKEQLKTLELIFDGYSRLLSSFLTGYLRTTVSVEVANAEQLPYNDFSASISNPAILSIVDFKPFKGSIVLDLSVNIGYAIIDRVLGGPGLGIKKIRDFSEIETILLERIISQMLGFMVAPWESIADISPKLSKIETNSQFAQIISPSDMIALISLNIRVGSVEGYFSFCIPHYVIEPIMDRLNTRYRFGNIEEEIDSNYKDILAVNLERAVVPVSVIVGRTNISVGDFINLQKGDIIPLDSYYTSDLDVMVGNLHKFKAKPGISKGKNAIQVTSIIRKEEQ